MKSKKQWKNFFVTAPHGTKARIAAECGISRTWLSQILSGRKVPGPDLAIAIEKATGGAVTRADLRPDYWEKK